MQKKVDKIFLEKKVKKFEFDQKVVPVFQRYDIEGLYLDMKI